MRFLKVLHCLGCYLGGDDPVYGYMKAAHVEAASIGIGDSRVEDAGFDADMARLGF